VGRAGLRELASGFPVAACRDVGLLFEGRLATACDHQSDFCGHDALYADRDFVHGADVHLARINLVAA